MGKILQMNDQEQAQFYGMEILQLVRRRMQIKMPEFSLAFGVFTYRPKEDISSCMGTDGETVFFHPMGVIREFLNNPGGLEHICFHMVLHSLYLHMIPGKKRDFRVWGIVCDWLVEYWADTVYEGWFPEKIPEEERRERKIWYEKLNKISPDGQTEELYQWALEHKGELDEVEKLFHRDCHPWIRESDARESTRRGSLVKRRIQLKNLEETAGKWNRIRGQMGKMSAEGRQRRGAASGDESRSLSLRKRKVYDYRRFLKRYAVFREELQLDLENFDYLPYVYSRQHYEKLVLLEPLETTEVHKLEELVIAIDTSGSCSGKVVQRFMEETYSILSSHENFFRKMHVVIIQCDSMIQDCTVIHSRQEWETYVENLRLQGFGGTDFCPVFRLVDQMIEKKELHNLRGLLYFTDGDGIYPRKKPSYETAFVFLNEQYKKQEVPPWAVTLNLNLKI